MMRMLCLATWFTMFVKVVVAAEPSIEFRRDIQPILAEHCWHCHGPDAATRAGELRLDQRELALRGGESGEPAIVAKHPDRSALMARITSSDPETMMPPPTEKKPLSGQQIEQLRRWIEQGAPYVEHWSFSSPRAIEPPSGADSPGVGAHPVDRWIAAKQAAVGLACSPPAPPEILCRRLYLDLIGLPPSPAQWEQFQRVGYEATVKQLLASEQYAEKWARHWLDVARYSDTNGYEKDLRREQWAWRDWVIDALHRDMPYDQFLVEQIAGDLLPGSTQQQQIATGFLRNSMLNEEGAIVAEQFRMVEMFDRMDCLGKGVLGLTTQCMQCHSHKFDPLTQDEYYGMFAFLNDAYEAQSWVYSDEQLATIASIKQEIATQSERIKERHPEWTRDVATWSQQIQEREPSWAAVEMYELGSLSGLNHPTQAADRSILMLGHASDDVFFLAKPDLQGITGVRLEVLTHGDLPFLGPGRSAQGTWSVREFEVWVQRPDSAEWQKLKLQQPTADFSSPEQKSADGKSGSGPVAWLVDGDDNFAWQADRGVGQRNQSSVAVIQFEQPLDLPAGTAMKFVLRSNPMVGCCRIGLTKSAQPVAPTVNFDALQAMMKPDAERTPQERDTIFAAWRLTLNDASAENEAIAAQWNRYPTAVTSVLHLAKRSDIHHRATHLLERGQWDRPTHAVLPHTPAALHPFPQDAPLNRLGFARWLASADSPLTARVAVNRVWQVLFGEGIVATPEDFGTRTPTPDHVELLDWLAVDFMSHGWSQKHLIERIVTSATYRQSSQATREALERDPRNHWLARGPRFRCDAEVVRDVALSVAGLLVQRRGGPPIIPPVPQNVLDYNYVYPSYWTPAQGADRYRRAVYGFRKRSMPDPVMANLDGPNGDVSCARRVRSNTPLAALTGLNETIFIEAAQALALRILREGGATDRERVDFAFWLCTSRHPRGAECDEVLGLLASRRQRIADGWINPREVATGDAKKLPELPAGCTPQDAAAWTLVARVLLNLDETLCKN